MEAIVTKEQEHLQTTRHGIFRIPYSDWLLLALTLTVVTLAWCTHYHRWSKAEWKVPVNYLSDRSWDQAFTGDAIWGMAATKAMATGEIAPLLPKYPISLGAPFRANWNDFPSIEEGINAWWALLAKVFGLFFGSNLVLLSAHLLAAASFYFVARYLGYARSFSVMGAALFALSRYAFWRGLPNLSLTFYWHLPLALLVIWWCVSGPLRWGTRRFYAAATVAVLHGVQSPYFSGLFMQLLGCAAVFNLLRWRNWRTMFPPICLGAILTATIICMNVDTLYSWVVDGPNAAAAPREYFDVERYALRPVEFFLPRSHALKAFDTWANKSYFNRTNIPGEEGSAYFGFVGALALALLCYATAQAVARREIKQIPYYLWAVLWVLVFSVTGGLNGIVAVFGFYLLRASNRYSIMILAAVLLFLVKYLTVSTRRWNTVGQLGLASVLLGLGIYDQLPPRFPEREVAAAKAVRRERRFVDRMEEELPAGAMIFQLPVYPFPEGPLIGKMTDYEHFRPYLHSHDLRFSYGATKGRYRDRWQREIEQLGTEGMLKELEKYGFAAVFINRQGYNDDAEGLVAGIRAAGKERILAEDRDWICIALNPARHVMLPPSFEKGWYDLEGNAEENIRWSSGDASIVLYNDTNAAKPVQLRFSLKAHRAQNLTVTARGTKLLQVGLKTEEKTERQRIDVTLQPGTNEIRFATDRPAKLPANGDPRKLAFAVRNFRVTDPRHEPFEEGATPWLRD